MCLENLRSIFPSEGRGILRIETWKTGLLVASKDFWHQFCYSVTSPEKPCHLRNWVVKWADPAFLDIYARTYTRSTSCRPACERLANKSKVAKYSEGRDQEIGTFRRHCFLSFPTGLLSGRKRNGLWVSRSCNSDKWERICLQDRHFLSNRSRESLREQSLPIVASWFEKEPNSWTRFVPCSRRIPDAHRMTSPQFLMEYSVENLWKEAFSVHESREKGNKIFLSSLPHGRLIDDWTQPRADRMRSVISSFF